LKKTKKVLSINSVNFGSTGTIMLQIADTAADNNYKTFVSVPSARSNYRKQDHKTIFIGNRIERNLHLKLAFYTGKNGCYSRLATQKFLKKVSEIKPDIIHLHNLHNCYINLELLFDYIKKNNISVVWTLHDCWAFTGQCPYYTMAECIKWKTGCHACPQFRQYPAAAVDKTKEMYSLKKEWFTGVKNMTLVTPSKWLKNQVEESFLSDYPVIVINNGIDLNLFKPVESDFRRKYGLEDKKILLGVAVPWSDRKGLNVFLRLSEKLNPIYKIVLVGLSNEQLSKLPKNIVGLPKTQNKSELAEIYASADIFINPTFEDNFPTTNLEALACGTPVITFETGGSVESIDETCGATIPRGDIDRLLNVIYDDFWLSVTSDGCVKRGNLYRDTDRYKDYIQLYNDILKKNIT